VRASSSPASLTISQDRGLSRFAVILATNRASLEPVQSAILSIKGGTRDNHSSRRIQSCFQSREQNSAVRCVNQDRSLAVKRLVVSRVENLDKSQALSSRDRAMAISHRYRAISIASFRISISYDRIEAGQRASRMPLIDSRDRSGVCCGVSSRYWRSTNTEEGGSVIHPAESSVLLRLYEMSRKFQLGTIT